MAIWPFGMKSGTDTANRARLAWSSLWTPSRDAPLKVTTGLINDGGGVVTVVAGTMDVSITPFRGMVQGIISGTQGGYPVINDAAGTVTLPNGGGAPVLTTIAAIVEDSGFDLSGQQRVRLVSYPTASGPPANSGVIPLREINLRAGVSVGTGGLLGTDLGTDFRRYTVAVGGVLPTLSSLKPGSPAIGQWIYETDTGVARVWTGAKWKAIRLDNLIVVDIFNANGNFVKTSDLKVARARIWGPGGGGGGIVGAGTGQSEGGGGGGGAYVEKIYYDSDLSASEAVVIGSGGAGVSGGTGGTGANSTFKALSAGAGTGGVAMTSGTTGTYAQHGLGGTATGGDLNLAGGDGGNGARNGTFVHLQNFGGAAGGPGGELAMFPNFGAAAGRAGKGPGGGGSGAYGTTSSLAGGAGAGGKMIMETVY